MLPLKVKRAMEAIKKRNIKRKKKEKKRKEKKKKGGVLVSLGLAHVMTKEGIL
jgi:hypothetical protein